MSLPVASVVGFAEQLSPRIRSASDKSLNELYYGSVLLPGGERRELAYVKVFPAALRGQLVYNEVLGYYLAMQCELPVPFTFPCACRKSLLKRGPRAELPENASSEYVLGIASVDVGKGIKQQVMSSEAQIADLLNWPDVAKLAVFDEFLGNDDRHLLNLVRRGPHEYVPVDNERIFCGEAWFHSDLDQLRTRRCDSNVLADTIAEAQDDLMRRRMINAAQHLMSTTLLYAPDVCRAIEPLCSAPEGITGRVIEMLNARRQLLRTLMQWHLQKGDLFQSRTNK